MAASLSVAHPFHTTTTSALTTSRFTSRSHIFLSCQSREPIDSSESKTKKEKDKVNKHPISIFYVGVQKLGRGLKEGLSPKQKGDWKDLLLMSLSFSVYVYISQRIVCAYCAWMPMLKQPW